MASANLRDRRSLPDCWQQANALIERFKLIYAFGEWA